GYSKEFIESILDEIEYHPQNVLEPFSGSGTTALELQFKNIGCTSFEVSPFMHLLSSVKLYGNYNIRVFNDALDNLKQTLVNLPILIPNIRDIVPVPFGKTVVKYANSKKWNFHDESLNGILDIKYSISLIEDEAYRNLFRVALASIILEVSNVFRN